MPYQLVQDFRLGVDRRRARVNGVPGSVWSLVNGHINRGGEIEAAKKFVATYNLPAGTFGLAAVGGQLFVFGEGTEPSGMPAEVTYQRLQHPTSQAMVRVLDVQAFDGKLYAIAEYANGDIFHYYNGARVESWDAIAADVASNNAVASALAAKIDEDGAYNATATSNQVTITAAVAGVPFTFSATAINGGAVDNQDIGLEVLQANVPAITEVLASGSFRITAGTSDPGTNRITSITVDGVEVLGSAVDWATSHTATAAAVAAQISTHTSSPNYSASSSGNEVTITAAAGSGATPNGYVLAVSVGGDVQVMGVEHFAGGVSAQSAVAQVVRATVSGTFEPADLFTITLDGKHFQVSGSASGTGTAVLTFGGKMYAVVGSLLYFSALNNPTQWGSGIGHGFINMANQNQGWEPLVGLAEYQGKMALFSRNSIRVWEIDADPDLNRFLQTVQGSGTGSPRAIVPYGNLDVFYLADSGVRSLRPRDVSEIANVDDVGTALDPLIQEFMATLDEIDVRRAVATFEPTDGRYWLALGNRIFVFSDFKGNKIRAWSWYEPGFAVTDFAKANDRIYARAGNTVYRYGGANGNTYPAAGEMPVTVELPYLSAEKPATHKLWCGFDAGLAGAWSVELDTNPGREGQELIAVGTLNRTTYPDGRAMVNVNSSHVAPVLVCSHGGKATVSNMALHYELHEAG